MRRIPLVVAVLGGAVVLGGLVGAASGLKPPPAVTNVSAETLSGCRVVDGDTLRCADERIRLLGIDAPELPGHCRSGRNCAPGNPFTSIDSLRAALAPPLRITRLGIDRYGRTLALVSGAQGDLSCWQLSRGQAVYKRVWDDGRQLAAICPGAR